MTDRLSDRLDERYIDPPNDITWAWITEDEHKEIAALEQRVEGLDTTLSMFQGFSVSELLRVIAKDYDRSDVGNSVKMRRAMWLRDLADKLDALVEDDPDKLPTQQKPTEEAMEEA